MITNLKELVQLHCSPVTANTPRLAERDISRLKKILPGWETHEKRGVNHLEKTFQFKDFNEALVFTNQAAKLANKEDHHPAILTEWGKVTITWWTHKIKGLSMNDFIMAAKTEQLLKRREEHYPGISPVARDAEMLDDLLDSHSAG